MILLFFSFSLIANVNYRFKNKRINYNRSMKKFIYKSKKNSLNEIFEEILIKLVFKENNNINLNIENLSINNEFFDFKIKNKNKNT